MDLFIDQSKRYPVAPNCKHAPIGREPCARGAGLARLDDGWSGGRRQMRRERPAEPYPAAHGS